MNSSEPAKTSSGFLNRLFSLSQKRLVSAHFDLSDKRERQRSVKELETLFFSLCQRSDAEIFLEVGAKDAVASRFIAKNQKDKKVVAFEANPYTFKRFTKQHDYEHLGVDYRNMALSEHIGSVKMNVRKNEKGNPCADGQASLLKHKNYPPGHLEVEVEATTLKEVVHQLSDKKYILWIDVEGALESVLKGGKGVLGSLQVAFVEVETKVIWSGQWIKSDVDKFFTSNGFVQVARDYQSRWQCNVIYMPEKLVHSVEIKRLLSDYLVRIRSIDGAPLRRTKILKNLFVQLFPLRKWIARLAPK